MPRHVRHWRGCRDAGRCRRGNSESMLAANTVARTVVKPHLAHSDACTASTAAASLGAGATPNTLNPKSTLRGAPW